MGQKQEKAIKNNEAIIIGIDFGSSGISFSYGFLYNKETPTPGYFDGQNINNKISSKIILDDDLNLLAFGNDCDSYLSSINKKSFHHFKNIKMNLYIKIYLIKDKNTNKEVNIQIIIKLILKEVKNKASEQIKRSMPTLKKENIHWTLTVPAIWDIKSKQIMINAALEAGLIRDDDDLSNFFALEPEAASIYYNKSPQAYNGIENFNDPFIVCDFGAGTVDIVTHKLIKTKKEYKFNEIYRPLGGDNGCNKINEDFMNKVIKELFGNQCFNETKKIICENEYNSWIELENKIEEYKKKFINPAQLKEQFQID